MLEKSKNIFGNEISARAYKSACRSKKKYQKKFGDDSRTDYPVSIERNPYIGDSLGVRNILLEQKDKRAEFDVEKGIIVGNSFSSKVSGLHAILDGFKRLSADHMHKSHQCAE